MAFRNILYIRKSLSKDYFSNVANYSKSIFNEFHLRDKKLIIVQSNRLYHLTEINNFKISKLLCNGNPPEQSDVNYNKSTPKIPLIDPNNMKGVFSDIPKKSVEKVSVSNVKTSGKTVAFGKEKDVDIVKPKTSIDFFKRNFRSVIDELKHLYHGCKLFILEMRVASGILLRFAKGKTLTRRERNHLVRSLADMFRMVPFTVFIVVPFMEFLLPLYVKFFPNMLPSTFKNTEKEAEKLQVLLKRKLDMAKIIQETLEETISVEKYSSGASVSLKSFNDFMKQVRESGQTADTEDILKFSRLFEDEVTLESLEYRQLQALCRLLELSTLGTRSQLILYLKLKVFHLRSDDRLIEKEGIDQIPAWELQQLCRERGMRAMGVSEERLRFQLSQWLNLSIKHKVPLSLLLLTRTMYLPEHLSAEQQLKKAMLDLPNVATKEASLRTIDETENVHIQTKLELVKEEHEAILEEREATEKLRIEKETLVDKAPIITEAGELKVATSEAAEDSISTSDLNQIESAIESIVETKTAVQEEEIDELKEDTAELREESTVLNTRAGNRISQQLQGLIEDIDSMVDRLRVEKETITQNLVRTDELGPSKDEERVIAIGDVMKALKRLKAVSNDEVKWQRILDALDEDHDGQIEVHHLTEMLDLLGDEELKLTSKEMQRVLNAIDKQEAMEEEKFKSS